MDAVRHNEQTGFAAASPAGDTLLRFDRPQPVERSLDRPHAADGAPLRAPQPEAKITQPSPAAPAAVAATPVKTGRKRIVLPVLLLAALGVGSYYGHAYWTNGRFVVSTDDAYVQADVSTLGIKVSGYVKSVMVRDGDRVKSGDVLVRLDDVDYRLALESAEAKRGTAGATLARIDQQVVAQQAQIDSAQAGLASAKAEQVRADSAYERAQSLAQQNYGTRATLDTALADRDRAVAGIGSAQAALAAAQSGLSVIRAQRTEAEQQAKELDTAVVKAKSDLDSTVIRAPSDGVIGNRVAQAGQYVSPGSRLMALVPLGSIYVAANFKETQLGSIQPGQPAEIEVDALGGRTIEGRIESLSPASGSTFSLLPPENATGNFTKIVQRVPVRVAVPAEVAASGSLRPGLSVVVSVDSRKTK